MESSSASTPARGEAAAQRRPRAAAAASAKRCAKAAVVGVDEQLLAGLGVLHQQQPEVGQLHLDRVVEPHRDDLVPLREMGERLAPSPAR